MPERHVLFGEFELEATRHAFIGADPDKIKTLAENCRGGFACVYQIAKNRYIGARDPLGIAPLYYSISGTSLRCGSDPQSILAHTPTPSLNSDVMKRFAMRGTVHAAETMYEGIFRLPPGHILSVENGVVKSERYWFPEKIRINHSISFEDAALQLRSKLEAAIAQRYHSEIKTGCELSGGLDSSTVFSVTQDLGMNILPFSMRFDSLTYANESSFIDAVLHWKKAEGIDVASDALDYGGVYDMHYNYQKSPHWPLWITYTTMLHMAEVMHEHGIGQLLSGQAGDHLFQGSYETLHYLWRRGKMRSLIRELWSIRRRNRIKMLIRHAIVPWIKSAFHGAYNRDADLFLSDEFAQFMDTGYYRFVAQNYGMKVTHPFLDVDVVEFVLTLPPNYKFFRGERKRILREAMKNSLPEKVRTRDSKATFGELLLQQIHAIDLKAFWQERRIVELEIVSSERISQLIRIFETHKYIRPEEIAEFWRIINLESWYRHRIGKAQ